MYMTGMTSNLKRVEFIAKGVVHSNSSGTVAMATKGKYEFVEKLLEDFTCLICLDAVHGAVETKCCGVLLCMPCSDRLIASMMACPQCRAYPLMANENQFMRRKVRQLHIYCVNRHCCNTVTSHVYPVAMHPIPPIPSRTIGVDHCEWSGEINDLQSHLDNQCPHATVACRYNCGVKIVRCQRDFHEAKVCHKRPFSCWFCDMKSTAEEIDYHATWCDKRPIECPNKCLAKLLQGELKLHLEQCPLQETSCEFEYAGCKEKVLRKDYDGHIEDNTQKHLRLISNNFRAQIAILKQENKLLKQKVDEQAQKNEQQQVQLVALRQKMDEQNKYMYFVQEQIRMMNETETMKKNANLLSQLQAPTSLANIDIRVTLGGTSSPVYVLGYCMSVKCARGNYFGTTSPSGLAQTFVQGIAFERVPARLSLQLHPGQYDYILSWPLQGVVTLLLLHPTDRRKNKDLAYHIDETQRPTETVMIGGYIHEYLQSHNEYRLSIKSVTLK